MKCIFCKTGSIVYRNNFVQKLYKCSNPHCSYRYQCVSINKKPHYHFHFKKVVMSCIDGIYNIYYDNKCVLSGLIEDKESYFEYIENVFLESYKIVNENIHLV